MIKPIWLLVPLFALELSNQACDEPTEVPPNIAAKQFATQLGLTVRGEPVCADTDTDCDGYVTCTIATGTTDEPHLMSLQCGALSSARCVLKGASRHGSRCKLTPIIAK